MTVKTISKKEMSKLKRLGHAKTDSAEHSKRQRINAKKGWARRDRKQTLRQKIEDELYRKIHRLAQKVRYGGGTEDDEVELELARYQWQNDKLSRCEPESTEYFRLLTRFRYENKKRFNERKKREEIRRKNGILKN